MLKRKIKKMKRCFDCQSEFDKYKVELDYIELEEESITPSPPPKRVAYVTLLCPYCGIIISVNKK